MTNEVIQITGTGSQLQGVGRLSDGMTVFVPGALPGEEVRIAVTKRDKRFALARLEAVLSPSPERREPDCPLYGRCGGCQARHMRYETTLAFKRQRVFDALTRIGGLEGANVLPALGCEDTAARNKAEFSVIPCGDGGALAGVTVQGSHEVLPTDECLLQKPAINEMLRAFNALARRDLRARKLSGLVLRANSRGEGMMIFCGKGLSPAEFTGWLPALREALPKLRSCWLLRQKPHPTHALDGTCVKLFGDDALTETLLELSFSVSPQSFFQVNRDQAEVLYTAALEALPANGRILDAYCGTGTITLCAAARGHEALGVEIVAPAIADAKANARANRLEKRARFLCDDAARAIPRLIVSGERFDAALLDPPRQGANPALLRALMGAKVPKIVYVSCDPATLARDVKVLAAGGYSMEWAQPVDMFPWTGHVETVVLMSRKDR